MFIVFLLFNLSLLKENYLSNCYTLSYFYIFGFKKVTQSAVLRSEFVHDVRHRPVARRGRGRSSISSDSSLEDTAGCSAACSSDLLADRKI